MTHSAATTSSDRHYFYVARIIFETKSPLSIATGGTNGVHDNLLVRDANGLPTIPGSSLAGVLRHRFTEHFNEDAASAIFGVARDNDGDAEHPSLLQVSWACIHNQHNQAQQGLLDPQDTGWQNDPVLKDALQAIPIKRDHVKITHKGVADTENMGKFDRVSLTTGHRFSAEITLWSTQDKDPRWEQLLSLLGTTEFRLGGKTRAGLGKVSVHKLTHGCFDMRDKVAFDNFQQLNHDLNTTHEALQDFIVNAPSKTQSFTLDLQTDESGLRIGAGSQPINSASEATLVTLTERRIRWQNDQATIQDGEIIIPGSGIKGALRHRTNYYFQLLLKRGQAPSDAKPDDCVNTLFGYSAKNETGGTETQAGLIMVDDIYIKQNAVTDLTLAHNSIDRFTGGVREHMLYFEELIFFKKPEQVQVHILQQAALEPAYLRALKMAMQDLANGRLAIGAGSGRTGSGYFSGTCSPSLDNLERAA